MQRQQMGYTQSELADELAKMGWTVDAPAIARIESGKRSLRVPQLFMLALALGGLPQDFVEDPLEEGIREKIVHALEESELMVSDALREMLRVREVALEYFNRLGIDPEVDDFAKTVLRLLAHTELSARYKHKLEKTSAGPVEGLKLNKWVDERMETLNRLLAEVNDELNESEDG